ncbi:MAG: acyl-CoA thioesterase [Phaeodactylibacter sp.]|nr:acyl-CoA thioesterase [Phaeodactylibacter sp.]
MLPSYSNFSGKIHGGYVLNLMDQIAFACASKHCGHYCVTASVNKVDFLSPVEVGDLLILKASVNYTGNTSMVVGIRVESENIQSGKVRHCNSSYFTMVAKDEAGSNVSVPGLILDSVDAIRRFARSRRRQEHGRQRKHQFQDKEFNVQEHLHLLEETNSLITYKP